MLVHIEFHALKVCERLVPHTSVVFYLTKSNTNDVMIESKEFKDVECTLVTLKKD